MGAAEAVKAAETFFAVIAGKIVVFLEGDEVPAEVAATVGAHVLSGPVAEQAPVDPAAAAAAAEAEAKAKAEAEAAAAAEAEDAEIQAVLAQNVEKVLDELEKSDPERREKILAAERAGQNRKTIVGEPAGD